ncbi:ABC transporter substrate-binding protein, partial [Streptomyces sp. SID4931]|nr:ABC transporter substrate-binding protein [Streptomyces sp. SID4931]
MVTIGNTNLPFIDLGGKPVGVTEVSDAELAVLPKEQKAAYEAAEVVGSSGGDVDLEKLAALKPDLILVQFHANDWDKVGKRLESIAPTVLWGLDTEWKSFAGEIAEAGNVTGELDRQKTEFEKKVAQIKKTYGKT